VHYVVRLKTHKKHKATLASDQANMTLRTYSGFFIAKVMQFCFDVATSATENLHKKCMLIALINYTRTHSPGGAVL